MKIAFVGWGAVARATAALLDDRIKIVAIATRHPISINDLPNGARSIIETKELADTRPELVVEAASSSAVEHWALATFKCRADFIVSSVSAFADTSILNRLVGEATSCGKRLEIHAGALGGIDALAAAKLLGLEEVEHRIIKPPKAWQGTDAEQLCDLDAITDPTEFFSGTASATSARFPMNANVAMTTALAGLGPERTRVVLVADPHATANLHELSARGKFGVIRVEIANKPLVDNPKSSTLTALSLARQINNRLATLVI